MTQDAKEPIGDPSAGDNAEKTVSRRGMLAKLGLIGAAVYTVPVLMALSDASARSRSASRSRSRSADRKKKRRPKKGRSKSRSRSRSRSQD